MIGVEGTFERGDAVIIRDLNGREVGRGLAAYEADDAARSAAARPRIFSPSSLSACRAEMVHRDDLVVQA